jgi:hypothetical protein
MSTLELLRRLYVAGVDVSPNGEGGIRVSGFPPPPELIDALKAQRDAVLRVLEDHRIGTHDDDYGSDVPRRYVTPPGCLAPRLCARLGPCSGSLMTRPCSEGGES